MDVGVSKTPPGVTTANEIKGESMDTVLGGVQTGNARPTTRRVWGDRDEDNDEEIETDMSGRKFYQAKRVIVETGGTKMYRGGHPD